METKSWLRTDGEDAIGFSSLSLVSLNIHVFAILFIHFTFLSVRSILFTTFFWVAASLLCFMHFAQ